MGGGGDPVVGGGAGSVERQHVVLLVALPQLVRQQQPLSQLAVCSAILAARRPWELDAACCLGPGLYTRPLLGDVGQQQLILQVCSLPTAAAAAVWDRHVRQCAIRSQASSSSK